MCKHGHSNISLEPSQPRLIYPKFTHLSQGSYLLSSWKTNYLCQVLHLEEHPALLSLRRWRIPPDIQWHWEWKLCWAKAVGFNCCVYSCPKSPRAVAVQCIRDAWSYHACHRQQEMPSFNLIWMTEHAFCLYHYIPAYYSLGHTKRHQEKKIVWVGREGWLVNFSQMSFARSFVAFFLLKRKKRVCKTDLFNKTAA